MEACRDWKYTTQRPDKHHALSSWEYSIHLRDDDNNPLFANLPPVQGLARTATKCGSGKKIWEEERVNAVPYDEQRKVDEIIATP